MNIEDDQREDIEEAEDLERSDVDSEDLERSDVDSEEVDADDDVDPDETIVMTEMPVAENIGDTAEIKVDKLIEKVESQSATEVHRKKEVRRRLEELAESQSFEDTYAVDTEDAD